MTMTTTEHDLKVLALVPATLERKFIKIAEQIANLEHSGLIGAAYHWGLICTAYENNGPQGVADYCAPFMKKQDGSK
jgi:hypothetical protein